MRMDAFDVVMIVFFLVIPIALIVSLVLLHREKRARRAAEAELAARREEASALRQRLAVCESADNSKNSNRSG